MKNILLSLLLATNIFGQNPEPVREFKIYSSDSEVLGDAIFSGSVPSSKIKDFVAFVISGKDSTGTITIPVEEKLYIPKLKVSWLPNKELDIDYYLVNIKEKNSLELITLKTKETSISSNYKLNTEYLVNVRAVNKVGLISAPSVDVPWVQNIQTPAAPVILPNGKQRYINLLESVNGGPYISIGKIPYPKKTGQKYKTLIIEE